MQAKWIYRKKSSYLSGKSRYLNTIKSATACGGKSIISLRSGQVGGSLPAILADPQLTELVVTDQPPNSLTSLSAGKAGIAGAFFERQHLRFIDRTNLFDHQNIRTCLRQGGPAQTGLVTGEAHRESSHYSAPVRGIRQVAPAR